MLEIYNTELSEESVNQVDEIEASDPSNNPISLNLFDIPDNEAVRNEISDIRIEVDSLKFTKTVRFDEKVNVNIEPLEISQDKSLSCDDYDFTLGQLINILNIELGSSKIPRYSCGNHKLNIAVRNAIKGFKILLEHLRSLNQANSHVKRVIQLTRVFASKKCRLRLENLTRWSSAFLLLESVKRAYDRKAFDEVDICPITLETVELYLQILKPAYDLSISFQNDKSTISDTLPSIYLLINIWETMEVDDDVKPLIKLLVENTKTKFSYEMNSNIYKVI